MQPDSSIVVIAYQEQARIGRCLAALSAQENAGRFEVIVIDDGSTDATALISDEWSARDARIRRISLPKNMGRGEARRTGVAAAKGGHIGFIDADCTVPSTWLEQVTGALGQADLTGGSALPDGDIAAVARLSRATLRPKSGSIGVTGNNMMMRASVLDHVDFPTGRLGEDFRFVKRAEAAGFTQAVIDGLFVDHDETKTYKQSCRWLFESGVDATSLLREFGDWRLPDIAWMLWLSTALIGVPLGFVNALFAIVPVLAVTVSIASALTLQRFKLTPVLRFIYAAVLNTPLVGLYLLGRTAGVGVLTTRRLGCNKNMPS
ncbi:MAG: glycosyltransferase [Actinobacteria bacterium]|nr:glycosyltransferase [Actinomycetota bacterium]